MMLVAKRLVAALAACFVASSSGVAAMLPASEAMPEATQAKFDPVLRETYVASRVTPNLCFSLALPREWRVAVDDLKTSLNAVFSTAELDMNLRSARDLQSLPQSDLARRDAALLQRDYEGIFGRPAQSVSLASPAPGVVRWSATWIDANLPGTSHAMTIEIVLVPLSRDWMLEFSLNNVETREAYDALVRQVLSGLRVQGGAEC
ncbi:hypothetical protein [Microvirga alba]|uniref:ABC-type transport auxiliary lipoprotein component domain-containing protein n=1 Tax=Microvirga alba TaxID=2791025 RepID=A0A931FSL0_9HYPH|nr:hypothetical protein [Microvirga alba]MBF9233811.1 hypothetical protein [Microvirga alba]